MVEKREAGAGIFVDETFGISALGLGDTSANGGRVFQFTVNSGRVELVDKSDESVVLSFKPGGGSIQFEKPGQVPEYDAISAVPAPDPDGPYSSEPADPRAIVRFTSAAGVPAAGIYSYSVAEGKWVRLDRPK